MRKLLYALCASIFILGVLPVILQAQTDVAASVYGAFNATASSTNLSGSTTESPSNAAGVLLEVRHIMNPFVGFEGTYSYNRANRTYSANPFTACPALSPGTPCGPATATFSIPANAHEITGDWVVSMKLANLRPFALAGGGVLFTVPSSGTATGTFTLCAPHTGACQASTVVSGTKTRATPVFVYGAGLDWTLLPHLGLRFQYRGNLYKAKNLVESFGSLDSFTHTAEPMVGVFFRF